MKRSMTGVSFGVLMLLARSALADPAAAPDRELIPDISLPVPALHVDSSGALAIQAAPKYTDSASGKPYEGVALRLFDTKTRLWRIYWADSNSGALDPPVVGSFENKIGHFFARDTYKGQKIVVVFRWDARNPQRPIWSQAFSTDEGKTWEWNSINVSESAAP